MKSGEILADPLNESFFPPSSEKTTSRSISKDLTNSHTGKLQKDAGRFGARMPWVAREATFPHGTIFRGKYKGYQYVAKVDNGALVLNGREFLSPSAAAVSITRHPVDGWVFWDCKTPDESLWLNIREFKKRGPS